MMLSAHLSCLQRLFRVCQKAVQLKLLGSLALDPINSKNFPALGTYIAGPRNPQLLEFASFGCKLVRFTNIANIIINLQL